MKNIGFVGVGVMGKSMVRNLMDKGFALTIYTRTKDKVADLIAQGAIWAESPAQAAENAHAVITVVGYPSDVEQVYFGENGLIAAAKPGSYLIDMTTTEPAQAIRIFEAAAKRGVHALDAPVSGGDVGAKNATLSIMVGGEEDAFNACMPIFAALGKNILRQGGAGCGQHTKMANQIALAGAIAGVCESMEYARRAGLDVETMLQSISQGAAGSWQMSNMAPRMLKGDFAPGFYIKHYIKDMTIAQQNAQENDLEMGVLNQVLSMYRRLAQEGLEDLGTQALLRYYS